MSSLFWLSEAQMRRIEPWFPLSRGVEGNGGPIGVDGHCGWDPGSLSCDTIPHRPQSRRANLMLSFARPSFSARATMALRISTGSPFQSSRT